MKQLFSAFYGLFLATSISAQSCDLELLNMDWDEQTVTLTLNDNVCSNSSTPPWVPTTDSIYVVQLWFNYDATMCNLSSTTTNFYPPLGLNDTITYSFSNWSDPFNCFDNAFTSYQETCMATVTITGVNNSINLDLDNSNNYIGFNPIWDNCYDVVSVNEMLNVNKEVLGVWDFLGRYVQEDILGLEPNKPYLIRYTDGTTEKIFLR